jgi:hypothetical protein
MNPALHAVIEAGDDERRALFLEASGRMGAAVQYIEKDFWVCWTLDALFNGLPRGGPRLLFKGGTSLSKVFDLIPRFSEDIDATVFREDLAVGASAEELEGLSGKKRRARLDQIKAACQEYIAGALRAQFDEILDGLAESARIPRERLRVEIDPEDPDRQSLLLWYPSATVRPGDYVRSAVKIESGAKSALDPHVSARVRPYVDDPPGLDLTVENVTAIEPSRTFWDKVIILHGLRQWHDRRGSLRQSGRVSRHYHDLFRLLASKNADRWIEDEDLAQECALHARMFFPSTDSGLEDAVSGRFTLTPSRAMRDTLARDYAAMAGMIFGEVPSLDDVLDAVERLEARLNARA